MANFSKRPQPYRTEWPLTAAGVENIDSMFEILFKKISQTQQTALSASSTATAAVQAVMGMMADVGMGDGDDARLAVSGGTPGATGAQGPMGLSFSIPGDTEEPPLGYVGHVQGSLVISNLVVSPVIAGGQNSGDALTFYGSLNAVGNVTSFTWKTNSTSAIQMQLNSSGQLAVADGAPTFTSLGSGGTFVSAINSTASGGFQAASNLTASGSDIGYIDFGTFGTASAEKRVGAIHGFLTAASGASPTGELRFYTTAAGVIAEQLAITSAGKLRFNSTRGVLHSPANNNFTFEANNGGTGFGLQTGTADVMIVANQAQNAYAKVDTLGLKSSGVACPSFGPGAVTSITVVNGMITAIS